MDYISTKDAATKWKISLRYVQRLLHEGKVPGARKYGVAWMIPADAEKPTDMNPSPTTTTVIRRGH